MGNSWNSPQKLHATDFWSLQSSSVGRRGSTLSRNIPKESEPRALPVASRSEAGAEPRPSSKAPLVMRPALLASSGQDGWGADAEIATARNSGMRSCWLFRRRSSSRCLSWMHPSSCDPCTSWLMKRVMKSSRAVNDFPIPCLQPPSHAAETATFAIPFAGHWASSSC